MTDTARPYALEAQLLLAQIDAEVLNDSSVQIENVNHEDFTSFVKSKGKVDEDDRLVTIHQFVSERDPSSGRPAQVRIKVKTGEALNRHFPAADGPSLAEDRNLTGADLIAAWVDEAVAASGNPDAATIAASFVIDPDSMAAAGQDWVPEFATVRREDGVVHLQSRSMFIASNFPLPRGFVAPPGVLGVHYVAVPAPELIEDLVKGVATS